MAQLFEAQFRVHPTMDHSYFGSVKFGILIIWLFSTDTKTAGYLAKNIALTLPYRVGNGRCFAVGEDAELLSYQVEPVATARRIGINVGLQWRGPEADEEAELKNWPLLLPLLEG